jgi:hypothetical protein
MIKFLIKSVIIASLSSSALAQETFLFQSTGSVVYRVAPITQSFNNGPVKSTWLKLVSLTHDQYEMHLVEVHCPTGKYRLIKYQQYVNGGYLGDGDEYSSPKWNHPVPNTLGEALRRLC